MRAAAHPGTCQKPAQECRGEKIPVTLSCANVCLGQATQVCLSHSLCYAMFQWVEIVANQQYFLLMLKLCLGLLPCWCNCYRTEYSYKISEKYTIWFWPHLQPVNFSSVDTHSQLRAHTHTSDRPWTLPSLHPSVWIFIQFAYLLHIFVGSGGVEVRTTTEQNVLIFWYSFQTCQTEEIKRFHTELPRPLNAPWTHIKASQALPDPVFKPCGCQPSSSPLLWPPLSAGAVWRPGPGRPRRAGGRWTHQADRHLQRDSRQQDGVHRRILRRQERADNGSHGLHGQSAGGEAAEVLSRGQVPLPAG